MITEKHREAMLEPFRLIQPCGHHSYRKSISRETGRPHYRCHNCGSVSEYLIDKKTEATYRAY